MGVGRSLLLAAAVALSGAMPAAAQTPGGPSADAIMERASRAYKALSSFQADFRQRIDDPLVEQGESRGTLYQRGTNRFAMRFTEPANSAIVIDGTALWVYLPEDDPRNVRKLPMPGEPVYNYNLLAWLLDRPSEKYRATWLREESVDGNKTDVLLLEPNLPNIGFRRATVWIDRALGLPRRLEFDEKILIRTINLSRIRTNGTIPAAIFTFRVPSGVRVVE